MYLKSLEIQGFKSFPDRTLLQFGSDCTAIVGPNGSGKSNISDAVRWVLGEQSAKSLRGAKMEDVIFNGTEKRKPLTFCEVSLLMDNEDGALKIDAAEVLITRRVWRSGEGEYFINRAACRLRDIQDLFRDTGVGRDGYSVVGQGRVDEILSQKSEDRRRVFEEAVGIATYRARKEEAEKRMDNTQQNLDRVEDIISELEAQLGPLEKQAEDAKRYLALRDTLRDLYQLRLMLEIGMADFVFRNKNEEIIRKLEEIVACEVELERQLIRTEDDDEAREIAETLKGWIARGEFLLTEPVQPMPAHSTVKGLKADDE